MEVKSVRVVEMIKAPPQAMLMVTNKFMCFCTTLLLGRKRMRR